MWGGISLWFWFAFPWWLVMLSIFSCTYWPSTCFLRENVYSDLLPIFKSDCLFFCYLNCRSSLYILNISPLSDTWFTIIFSHSVGCFSFCWWLPLLCRSFLVCCGPTYLFLLLESDSKKSSPRSMSRSLFPYFLLGVLWFQDLRSSL